MEIFIGYFVFSIVVGVAASSRGRSGFGWFILSLLISPLLTLILVLVLPNCAIGPAATGVSPRTHHHCPECKELIRKDALKCRYCGSKLSPQVIDNKALERQILTPARQNIRRSRIVFGAIGGSLLVGFVAMQYIEKKQHIPTLVSPTAKQAGPSSPEAENQLSAAHAAREAEKAARDAQEVEHIRVIEGARTLRKAMHNPKSFELISALSMGAGVGCYEYRAENGFGALRIGRAVLHKGAITVSSDAGFNKLWNARCANKTGRELGPRG